MTLGLTDTARRVTESVDRPAGARLGRVSRIDRHSLRALDLTLVEHSARIPRDGDVIVGDWVWLQADGDDIPHVHVAPRYNVLSRTKASGDVQTLAANIDLVLLTLTAREAVRPGLVERLAVTGWESGATPHFVVTKIDELTDHERYVPLSVIERSAPGINSTLTSASTGEGIEVLRGLLSEPVSVVFLGHSGVGKSTLANRLSNTTDSATRAVRARDGKGRHTTTVRSILPVPGAKSVIIDTPGIRQLGMSLTAPLDDVFTDVEAFAAWCRFSDCSHTHDAGCAVRQAAQSGAMPSDRYRRYLALARERDFIARREKAERRDKNTEYSRFAREYRRARGH